MPELCKDYPLHIVTNWIGNTPSVAIGHYLQVTDTDFAKAIGVTCTPNLINKPDIELLGVDTNSNKPLGKESDTLDAETAQKEAIRAGSDMFSNVQNLIANPEKYSVLSGNCRKNECPE